MELGSGDRGQNGVESVTCLVREGVDSREVLGARVASEISS